MEHCSNGSDNWIEEAWGLRLGAAGERDCKSAGTSCTPNSFFEQIHILQAMHVSHMLIAQVSVFECVTLKTEAVSIMPALS